MDANTIQQLISNLGFPIVACVALYYMNMKTTETYNKTMEDMRDTINKNTETMQNILEHLKVEDK